MAIWDNISKKASGTTAKAVQQAKDLSEINRLNALISGEKKKLDGLYHALGMQYAQLHRSSFEEALADTMAGILEAERIIQESQEHIRSIRGIQCCAVCGAELSKNAAFCSSCGAPIPKPIVPKGPVCGNCGAEISQDMRFCIACGTALHPASAVLAQDMTPDPFPLAETVPVRDDPQPWPLEDKTMPIQEDLPIWTGENKTVPLQEDLPVWAGEDKTVPLQEDLPAWIQNQETVPLREDPPVWTGVEKPVSIQKDIPVCPVPEAKAASHKLCPNCMASLATDAVFCMNCGYKIP